MLGSTGSPSTAAILLSSYLSSRNLSVMSAARSETVQNALREPHFGWMKLGDAPARQIFAATWPTTRMPTALYTCDSLQGTNYDSALARVPPAMRVLAQSAPGLKTPPPPSDQ